MRAHFIMYELRNSILFKIKNKKEIRASAYDKNRRANYYVPGNNYYEL